MKGKLIKNICSKPLMFPGVFHSIESILGKMFGGFISCWHDLPAEIFKSHVESLHPSKPIPLKELIERHKRGKSTKGCFALTFDDGIGTTVRDISNLCASMGWPVTFYVPTGYVDGGILPYQKVEFIDQYLPIGNYLIPNNSKDIQNKKLNKQQLILSLTNLIYTEHFKVVNRILDYFVEQILDKEKKNLLYEEYPKPITWDEIEKLSKNPIISFQSHSVTHTAVSSLSENEIEDEMIKSKEIIEQHTGLKVHSFCYPYGAEKSIGAYAPKIAAKHYNSAVTLMRGRLKKNNPFYLPRIDLYNGDSPGFVRLKVILN